MRGGVSVLLVAGCLLVGGSARGEDSPAAETIFRIKCSGCHTVGQGVLVGPDLEGVTARREEEWLVAFIRSSQTVIGSGDPIAIGLFETYQRQRMPDHELTRDQIDGLLGYIAAGGPTPRRRSPAEIPAGEARPEDIERGRRLFFGFEPLANGAAACSACHSAGSHGAGGGASVASDLVGVYDKYRDRGLTKALRDSDFPLMRSVYRERPLTEEERFALKAFLCSLGGEALERRLPRREPPEGLVVAQDERRVGGQGR